MDVFQPNTVDMTAHGAEAGMESTLMLVVVAQESKNYEEMCRLMKKILLVKKHQMSCTERSLFEKGYKKRVDRMREGIRKIDFFMAQERFKKYEKSMLIFKIKITREIIDICRQVLDLCNRKVL